MFCMCFKIPIVGTVLVIWQKLKALHREGRPDRLVPQEMIIIHERQITDSQIFSCANIIRKLAKQFKIQLIANAQLNKIIISKTKMEGMEQPELYWIPSIGPGGMCFVKGDIYPAWKGDLMASSMRFGYINHCIIKGKKIIGQDMLIKNMRRIRDIQQSPGGHLYISVEKGYIFRLVPVKK